MFYGTGKQKYIFFPSSSCLADNVEDKSYLACIFECPVFDIGNEQFMYLTWKMVVKRNIYILEI
jgi:hypothetical protein